MLIYSFSYLFAHPSTYNILLIDIFINLFTYLFIYYVSLSIHLSIPLSIALFVHSRMSHAYPQPSVFSSQTENMLFTHVHLRGANCTHTRVIPIKECLCGGGQTGRSPRHAEAGGGGGWGVSCHLCGGRGKRRGEGEGGERGEGSRRYVCVCVNI